MALARSGALNPLSPVSESNLAAEVGHEPIAARLVDLGETRADSFHSLSNQVRLPNHFRYPVNQSAARQPKKKIEIRARVEDLVSLQEGSGCRDIHRLKNGPVAVARDLDISVEQHSHGDSGGNLEQISNGLPQPRLVPIRADRAIRSEVDLRLRLIDLIRVGQEEQSRVVARGALVSDRLDQLVDGDVGERVGDDDEFECSAENQIVEKRGWFDRVDTEIRAAQHRCDPFEAGILCPDYQNVLPRIGHLSIITQEKARLATVLGCAEYKIRGGSALSAAGAGEVR